MIPRNNRIATIGLLIALGSLAVVAAAEDDPDAIIKYRQGVMKAQGGLMTAMSQVVRGKVKNRDDDFKAFAQALTATTSDIPSMFPEGSDFGETDALEKIWEDWDAFEKAANKADTEAAALLKASESGDDKAIQKAFKDMSEACKGCHKEFRAEEE